MKKIYRLWRREREKNEQWFTLIDWGSIRVGVAVIVTLNTEMRIMDEIVIQVREMIIAYRRGILLVLFSSILSSSLSVFLFIAYFSIILIYICKNNFHAQHHSHFMLFTLKCNIQHYFTLFYMIFFRHDLWPFYDYFIIIKCRF